MISIAMATYNCEKYIGEQIESILNQTITDIELVIVDDCSKDRTSEIVRDYALKDSRIRYYQNEKDLGYTGNFERAISLTSGDYIALSDQDDVWTSDHIEVLLNNLNGKALSCGNVSMVDSYLRPIGYTWSEMNMTATRPKDDVGKFYSILFFQGAYQGASMLFTNDLKEKLLPFPDKITYHDVWISLLACLNGGVSYTDRSIAAYRIHGNNVSGTHNRKANKYRSYIRMFLRGIPTDRIYYIKGLKKVIGGNQDTLINEVELFYNRQQSVKYIPYKIVDLIKHIRRFLGT